MADQQPTVVSKGDDPLTVSAEQDVPDSETQSEETSLSDVILSTSMSTPQSVMNGESMTIYGKDRVCYSAHPFILKSIVEYVVSPAVTGLQLKLDGQDRPFVSFTYALSPLTDKLAPVDWKLLVTTEDIESQHIRCHELQTGDNLPELVASFQNSYAVAVVLINTSDNFTLHPRFLAGTQEGSFPVLLLTKTDGMALLNKVEQFEENVFARISVESFVDLPMQQTPLQKTGKGHAHTSPEQAKEPGQCVPRVRS